MKKRDILLILFIVILAGQAVIIRMQGNISNIYAATTIQPNTSNVSTFPQDGTQYPWPEGGIGMSSFTDPATANALINAQYSSNAFLQKCTDFSTNPTAYMYTDTPIPDFITYYFAVNLQCMITNYTTGAIGLSGLTEINSGTTLSYIPAGVFNNNTDLFKVGGDCNIPAMNSGHWPKVDKFCAGSSCIIDSPTSTCMSDMQTRACSLKSGADLTACDAAPWNFMTGSSGTPGGGGTQPVATNPAVCDPATGCSTSIGTIPTDESNLVSYIITFGIALGGGLAFLMMIIGGYEIITNPAGPEEIQEGKQVITNALLGLLMIIFSVLILRVIGSSVLGINGLPFG